MKRIVYIVLSGIALIVGSGVALSGFVVMDEIQSKGLYELMEGCEGEMLSYEQFEQVRRSHEQVVEAVEGLYEGEVCVRDAICVDGFYYAYVAGPEWGLFRCDFEGEDVLALGDFGVGPNDWVVLFEEDEEVVLLRREMLEGGVVVDEDCVPETVCFRLDKMTIDVLADTLRIACQDEGGQDVDSKVDGVALDALVQEYERELVALQERLDKVMDSRTLEGSRVWDLYVSEDSTYASIVVCDDMGERDVYIYNKLRDDRFYKLDGSVACGVKWSPNHTYYLVDRGTYVQRGGTIHSALSNEQVGQIGYVESAYWLNDEELIFCVENPDVPNGLGVDPSGTTDIVKYNVVTGERQVMMTGEEGSYYSIDGVEDGAFRCEKHSKEEITVEWIRFE